MSDSNDFIELALKKLSCSQKELAIRVGVSPTQISKWKKGEYMSHEMEKKFREITEIGDRIPAVINLAGSIEDADKWEELIRHLADLAEFSNETGYITHALIDNTDFLSWSCLSTLQQMGIAIPEKFPDALSVDYESVDEHIEEQLESNIYYSTIYKIFRSYVDVYGFYAAYIEDLIDDEDLDLICTDADNIEPCLIELAAAKIEMDTSIATDFLKFKHETMKNYKNWLDLVKTRAFKAGIPLKAELLNLIYETHESLGQEAESECLGFNSARIHPDVYMNELLCGMRTIHQVLPAILKKLGIDEEFKLDTSEFYLG